jgi:hypothetical protein
MKSIVEQIRSKPTQTNDDVAEEAHYEDAADRDVTQPVGKQEAKLPGDYDERANFFFVPRPVTPPFGLAQNMARITPTAVRPAATQPSVKVTRVRERIRNGEKSERQRWATKQIPSAPTRNVVP